MKKEEKELNCQIIKNEDYLKFNRFAKSILSLAKDQE